MGDPTRVLVVLETADESEVPLEIAARVDDADTDIEQTVCSFRPPAEATFGVDVVSLDGDSRLAVRPYRRLYSLIGRADVVHVHPNAVGAVTRLMATVRRADIVTTEHNTHTDFGRVKNLVNGGTNWLSDVVVPVSETVAASFRSWEDALLRVAGVEKTVVNNGVDVEAVRAGTDREPPIELPEGFLIGSGGRMVPQKNLEAVIQALAVLDERSSDTQFHLVLTGDGPLRASLERRVDDLGLADSVTFTGFLPERADVYALLGRLDAFALPSHHEGWGVAIGEAMAVGVPVVASNIPTFREVVGDAGMYVDPTDPADLATALASLSEDPDRGRGLGRKGRERVTERFPIDATVAEYCALYDELRRGER